jgi:hypothetical protein
MDAKNSHTNSDLIVIKDPNGQLWTLAGIIFFGIFTIWNLTDFEVGGIIFGGVATYLFYLAFKAKNEGVVVDFANDKITYPGGKAADDIGDYIKLDYWKQSLGMSRLEVKLSEISSISANSTSVYDPKTKTNHIAHAVGLKGIFGSISIGFGSEGKRDQLYTILRERLNMGTPVVVAN